eukprot:12397915-Karenia_brevis.AAC.1
MEDTTNSEEKIEMIKAVAEKIKSWQEIHNHIPVAKVANMFKSSQKRLEISCLQEQAVVMQPEVWKGTVASTWPLVKEWILKMPGAK